MRLISLDPDEREALSKGAIYSESWAGLLGNTVPSHLRAIRNRSDAAPDALNTIIAWLNDHWTGLDDWDSEHQGEIALDLLERLVPSDA